MWCEWGYRHVQRRREAGDRRGEKRTGWLRKMRAVTSETGASPLFSPTTPRHEHDRWFHHKTWIHKYPATRCDEETREQRQKRVKAYNSFGAATKNNGSKHCTKRTRNLHLAQGPLSRHLPYARCSRGALPLAPVYKYVRADRRHSILGNLRGLLVIEVVPRC